MSNLTVFNFESKEVRFVGTADIPEWVASDVVAILYPEAMPSSYSKYLSKVPPHKKGKKKVLTPGGEQEVVTLFEGGFYRLILRSNSPRAAKIQDWVEDIVLPTIRKTGKYELSQSQPEPIALPPAPQDIASIIDLTLGKTDLDPKLIAGLKLNAIAKYHPAYEMLVETVKPSLSISVETELVRPTKLGEMLAETTGETWSAIKVNKLLIEQEFQVKNPDGKNPAYLPTEKGKKYGQLVLDTAKGRDKTVQSLQWHKEVLEAIEVDDH